MLNVVEAEAAGLPEPQVGLPIQPLGGPTDVCLFLLCLQGTVRRPFLPPLIN